MTHICHGLIIVNMHNIYMHRRERVKTSYSRIELISDKTIILIAINLLLIKPIKTYTYFEIRGINWL